MTTQRIEERERDRMTKVVKTVGGPKFQHLLAYDGSRNVFRLVVGLFV